MCDGEVAAKKRIARNKSTQSARFTYRIREKLGRMCPKCVVRVHPLFGTDAGYDEFIILNAESATCR